jgi:hypothetical protein
MKKNDKPFDVTVGGGTSQTQVMEDADGFTFRGGWGNILVPWDLIVWAVKGVVGLLTPKPKFVAIKGGREIGRYYTLKGAKKALKQKRKK